MAERIVELSGTVSASDSLQAAALAINDAGELLVRDASHISSLVRGLSVEAETVQTYSGRPVVICWKYTLTVAFEVTD